MVAQIEAFSLAEYESPPSVSVMEDIVTFDPPRTKCVLTFLAHFYPRVHFSHQCNNGLKTVVPHWGIKLQSLPIWESIITTRSDIVIIMLTPIAVDQGLIPC